jgi:dethiobiotin synthetase
LKKLKSTNQKILGIILNGNKDKNDISVKSNAKLIKQLTKLPVLELGYNERIDLRKSEWIIK